MSSDVEDIYVRITVRSSEFRFEFAAEPNDAADFQFHLCRKPISLAEIEFDQFWMPIPSLYGQRGTSAANQQPIVDFWWTLCGLDGSQTERDIQESYLLAKILPHARSNGSRRVFVDSVEIPTRGRRHQIEAWVAELDRLLYSSRSAEYDDVQFRGVTANSLGPPEYDPSVEEKYHEMSERLFSDARNRIQREGVTAVQSVLQDWENMMTRIGRRRGNTLEKQVLDILSYECRTALHRCYSAVWEILLRVLAQPFHLTQEGLLFHQFWHLEHSQLSNLNEAYFHLFHGHVFALHPACGPFLLTPRGQESFATYLRDRSETSRKRLLHALSIAVYYYSNKYEITKELRKNESVEITQSEMSDHIDTLDNEERLRREEGKGIDY